MKTRNKALLLALCALLLVVTTVFATLAYLTDTDEVVTNTFTVGNVIITLNESKVNLNGTLYDEGNTKVTENEYKLFPGGTYVKDPVMTIDSESEAAWVFVKVDNQIASIEADGNKIAAQLDANGWKLVDGTTNVYAQQTIQSAGASLPLFEEFSVANDVDNEAFTALDSNNKIVIYGYAIQADGIDSVAEAWTALEGELNG